MLVSRLLVSVLFCASAFTSSASASVAGSETSAPAAEAAIQAADGTPADADPQPSDLASIQAVEQAPQEQLANQPAEDDQQSLMAAAPGELEDPGTDAEVEASQTEKLAAIEAAAASEDRELLSKYMQDDNAAVQVAAFDALAAHDNAAAVESLLAEIKDVSQPFRLQALQVLAQSPQADEQIVMTTLMDALNGADVLFSAYAAQALAQRGTPEAMDALSEMLNGSDPSTRLMVLQSVAQTEAGLPLLRAALSDSNETVRSAAAVLVQQGEE
jgi:HEAT repeat protein